MVVGEPGWSMENVPEVVGVASGSRTGNAITLAHPMGESEADPDFSFSCKFHLMRIR